MRRFAVLASTNSEKDRHDGLCPIQTHCYAHSQVMGCGWGWYSWWCCEHSRCNEYFLCITTCLVFLVYVLRSQLFSYNVIRYTIADPATAIKDHYSMCFLELFWVASFVLCWHWDASLPVPQAVVLRCVYNAGSTGNDNNQNKKELAMLLKLEESHVISEFFAIKLEKENRTWKMLGKI